MRAAALWAWLAAGHVFAQGPQGWNVRQFGAAGDGVTLDTASVNKAVDACSKAGGGTVYFPAGTYLSGTIHLKDNITLWLDSGATLTGTTDLAQYDTAVAGQVWYQALILAKDVRNVAVIGRGAVDGNKVFNPQGEEHMRGPHALMFYNARDVTVRDISIKNAGNYNLILRSSEGLNIDGITVRGGWDGINMHDTRNATISNSRIFTGDDSLAGAYWENVTVANCILNSSANAIRVGGRNVLFTNLLIYGPGEFAAGTSLRHRLEAGFQILPQRAPAQGSGESKLVAPGPIDNMVVSNTTMINVGTPIYIAYSADAPYSANNLGVGRITFNNVTVTGAGLTPIYVSAPRENPAKSLVLNNVRVEFKGGGTEVQARRQGFSPFSILQSYGLYGRNVDRIELHDVRFSCQAKDRRTAIFGENIGTLELDRFHAEREPGYPPLLQMEGGGRLLVEGKNVAATAVRVLDKELSGSQTEELFDIPIEVENGGTTGLATVPLRLGNQTRERKVWLAPDEKTTVWFLNLRHKEPAERITATPVSAPYQTFQNTKSEMHRAGDAFYIRAAGDFPLLQFGDQYGSIYQPGSLPLHGSIVVKLENPDMRTNWVGRAGIIVRNSISKPGQPGGYVILASSPAAGSSLEWDEKGTGRLDRHTEFDGYTVWPHWLKLEREGARFTGFRSDDGVHWTKVGEADVRGAADTLDAGMFAYRDSALFEDFKIGK